MKGGRKCVEYLSLSCLGCEQILPRILVPFAPRSQQTSNHKTDSRISVKFVPHRDNKSLQGIAQARIIVVGIMDSLRRKRCSVFIQPCCDLQPVLHEEPGSYRATGNSLPNKSISFLVQENERRVTVVSVKKNVQCVFRPKNEFCYSK